MRKFAHSAVPLALLAALFATFAATTPAQSDSPQDDPPGRVGRLNYTNGSVSYQVQGDTDWVAADPNRPLTTGDNLWVDKDSRGELHVDSNAIRMSSETGLSFLTLDDRTVQLELPQGTIEVHLRQLSPGDAWEIDTPNLAFTLTKAGEYLISTDPNGTSTSIIVREGEGEVTGGGNSWDLIPGQAYNFNGADQLAYDPQPAPDFTDFEVWSQTRDEHENDSVSAQYVSRDVDGYYDLDQYGDWSEDPDNGEVWYPRGVAVDWVPYHGGHWVYIAPWGWTWVDEEPWGFAPFHYGRWVLVGARWGWVPGPRVVRPVYAPALVGFVGGAGFGLSVSIGGGFTGVAWFPLGPRDVFVPAYHCSPHYVQHVNVTNTRVVNVTQVTNVYNTVIVNRDVTHVSYTYAGNARAVTAVSRETFVSARPVARESVHINDTQIRNVRVVSTTAIAPTRASYVSANAKVVTARPAVPFSQRPVVANLPPRAPIQVHRAPQTTAPLNNGATNGGSPSNDGFRSFGNQGNNQRNGRVQPPPANNTVPVTNAPGARVEAQGGANNGAQPANPRPNGSNSPNNGPASNNNGGFRPFAPPNRGNSPNGPANAPANNASGSESAPRGNMTPNAPATNNHTQPQVQQNNQNNSDRYRYSPPVKANDNNYDVHPPLNQNQDRPQAQPQSQPREQVQPREQSQPSRPARENNNNGNNNGKDNKK